MAESIDICCVEKIDTEIERLADGSYGFSVADRSIAMPSDSPATESYPGHIEFRSTYFLVFHNVLILNMRINVL